jgi:hypothetical protein
MFGDSSDLLRGKVFPDFPAVPRIDGDADSVGDHGWKLSTR